MALIDPDRLRLRTTARQAPAQRPMRVGKGEPFLKGPVPLRWLEAAASLPGKSLHAGVVLWYLAGLTRSMSVRLSNVAGDKFGLDRNAKYRALAWLEGAGLIRVTRKVGRSPVITILAQAAPT